MLWILALAAHLGLDALLNEHKSTAGLGNATIILYLAITPGVQRAIVAQRAQRLRSDAGSAPPYGSGPVSAS